MRQKWAELWGDLTWLAWAITMSLLTAWLFHDDLQISLGTRVGCCRRGLHRRKYDLRARPELELVIAPLALFLLASAFPKAHSASPKSPGTTDSYRAQLLFQKPAKKQNPPDRPCRRPTYLTFSSPVSACITNIFLPLHFRTTDSPPVTLAIRDYAGHSRTQVPTPSSTCPLCCPALSHPYPSILLRDGPSLCSKLTVHHNNLDRILLAKATQH